MLYPKELCSRAEFGETDDITIAINVAIRMGGSAVRKRTDEDGIIGKKKVDWIGLDIPDGWSLVSKNRG